MSTGSPIQLSDGSFYPDLLDIPHRGRGGGSPSGSGMSASSTVPDTSRLTLPLNAAHLAGHPSYASQVRHVDISLSFHSISISSSVNKDS